VGALGFLVFELAKIHQPAHRRLGQGRDFHQVHFSFFSHLHGLAGGHNSDLFAINTYEANLANGDLFVDALRFLLSDGYFSC
jgi:hypothetical protein